MQPLGNLLGVALGVQGQQEGEHVVAVGIGPAVEPGQLVAASDGAVGLQLALEIKSASGNADEQIAAIDALLEFIWKLVVFFRLAVVVPEAGGGGYIA